MRRRWMGALVLGLVLGGCEDDYFVSPGDGGPAAPRNLAVSYYGYEVTVTWELGSGWDGEAFRVYGKRSSDRDYFLIAEVTNCFDGYCSYADSNILASQSYDYYVAAVDAEGYEAASSEAVRVDVPNMAAPPVPDAMGVIALDNANYLVWGSGARSADDFGFYRVYYYEQDTSYLLGETDSEGFLDLLAANGSTYTYFVTAVDLWGHESGGSSAADGTPRPDYHGDVVYDHFARPGLSGFVFQEDEASDPIVSGTSSSRHFRLETDADGWWLVPGPGVTIHSSGYETTALKCGPASDAGCVSLEVAPSSGYQSNDVGLLPQTTYVMRVPAQGGYRVAAIRVELLGFDQAGDPLMIFDWAYQLQVGNPNLAPRVDGGFRIR
ncbi:fibronectin type III domain-containing protein [Gaopeijia maritima]|uniref:Fibronectin type-III domain-containing protein n=1 Tax=Gaopeijia maritima TaxID=3119007 RepID=A0ABU9EBS1_9BACT